MKETEAVYNIYKKHPYISIDSRNIKTGSIFFALQGEKLNGNIFAKSALDAGASFAVINDVKYKRDERYIVVKNVLQTLQELARFHRNTLNIPVIAITGSNGKTTTKELIKAVLSQKYIIHATVGNLNNHIGVPLTLLSIPANTEIAVIEMGANHTKEIAFLCGIAKPNFGLITSIGKAHLLGFGGSEGVKRAKKELYDYLKIKGGTVFINKDNKDLMQMAEALTNTVKYGISADAECIGEIIKSEPFVKLEWRLRNSTKKYVVSSKLVGKYNFENILAAICIGNYFKIDPQQINRAIENYEPSNNRSQLIKKGSNIIILDAYNANPSSMAVVIGGFMESNAANKILILGDMFELGETTDMEHKSIIDLLKGKKYNKLILVGEYFGRHIHDISCLWFPDVQDASKWLKNHVFQDSHFLIKGSRKIGLENLINSIK